MAIIDKSIPRPITTIAMPSPRMPNTDTLRTRVNMFWVVKNPGKNSEKLAKSRTKIMNTMIC